MFRTVRERFRFRRPRRHDPPGSPGLPPKSQTLPLHTSYPALQSESTAPPEYSDNNDFSDPTVHSDMTSKVNKHHSTGISSESFANDASMQPRVFRNRSLEYSQRRPFLGFLPGIARRPFNWSKQFPERNRSPRDRPVVSKLVESQPRQPETHVQNEGSLSSLPSTHASRDPFLNDDVPVEIFPKDGTQDRPRLRPQPRDYRDGRESSSRPLNRIYGGKESPRSITSIGTFRKRSSLWRRKYDPHNEFQAPHERAILKATALIEASVKERNVHAAQQLALTVDEQIKELNNVLSDVDKRVERAQIVAEKLPSVRDTRYEPYLRVESSDDDVEVSTEEGSDEHFGNLHWIETVWDIESLIAEKQYEDAVKWIEQLQKDDLLKSTLPKTFCKLQGLILQIVSELSLLCAHGGGESSARFAPILGRLGMADHARQVVLDSAEAELTTELQYIISDRHDSTPHWMNVMLDKTLTTFRHTHDTYMRISSPESTDASTFVAWLIDQVDRIYKGLISPSLGQWKNLDPARIFATVEAIRYRRFYKRNPSMKNEKSLISMVETRIMSHMRKELGGLIKDAERQLVERAETYASVTPADWSDGPYRSGKSFCDELDALSRGLEVSLMNIGADVDALMGNLLVRPVLMYCTTLLETAAKALAERDCPRLDVQHGIFATFMIIGNSLLQLHQKFKTIPMLERVGVVLTAADVGEVRVLHAELFTRLNSSTSLPRSTATSSTTRALKV